MAWIYRREERERAAPRRASPVPEPRLGLARQAAFFALLVAILVFANWAPAEAAAWARDLRRQVVADRRAPAALLLAVLVAWLGLRALEGGGGRARRGARRGRCAAATRWCRSPSASPPSRR